MRTVRRAVAASLVLAACGSETALGPDPPAGPTPVPPTDTVGGDSPWDDVRPDELPEVWFAVGWSEEPCVPGREPDHPGRCPDTFAVIDLLGTAGAELALPEDAGRLLGTAAGGPGRFLLRTEQGPADAPTAQVVWEADAVEETVRELLRLDRSDSSLRVPDAEPLALAPGAAGLRAGASPLDAERLFVAVEADGEAPLLELIELDLSGGEPRRWAPSELTGLPYPLTGTLGELRVHADEAGDPILLLALRLSPPGEPLRQELMAWSPEEGRLWSRALRDPASTRLGFVGTDGGVALHLTRAPEADRWGWRVEAEDGSAEGPLAEELASIELGTLLDPAGPTFAVLAADALFNPPDRLVVLHRGEAAATIEELRFGLLRRRVFLHSMVGVPLP